MKVTKATMRVGGSGYYLIYVEPKNSGTNRPRKCMSLVGHFGEDGGDWEVEAVFDSVNVSGIKEELAWFVRDSLTRGVGTEWDTSDLLAELGLSPEQDGVDDLSNIKVETFEI